MFDQWFVFKRFELIGIFFGREGRIQILGQKFKYFFHATYQEIMHPSKKICKPIKNSCNLSRNNATSWDSSQDSDPWWGRLDRFESFFGNRPISTFKTIFEVLWLRVLNFRSCKQAFNELQNYEGILHMTLTFHSTFPINFKNYKNYMKSSGAILFLVFFILWFSSVNILSRFYQP